MAIAASEIAAALSSPAPLPAYWHCRRCGKLLGTSDGTLLTIRHGRLRLRVSLAAPIERRCERCGEPNTLGGR